MYVTNSLALLAMQFLLGLDAEGLSTHEPPIDVLAAVERFDLAVSVGQMRGAVSDLRAALNKWAVDDRERCLALLGPVLS